MNKIIDQQFEVLEVLGEGLSGQVFKVKRGEEIWALKALKQGPKSSEAERWVEAFKFEFSLLKDISHPNVVQIGDFGWDAELNTLYFTEELISGIPLDEYLKTVDMRTAINLFEQCLAGLDAIHKAQALHGDIKPSNIFAYKENGQHHIKILDLGIAHPKFHLTAGTPAYFCPEKILKEPVDERADLYSLAVTFYECLTGTNPFRQGQTQATLRAHTTIIPADAGSLNPQIPPYFNRILMNLMEKNPADRPRYAQTVLHELQFEQDNKSSLERRPAISEKWVGRDKAIIAVADWVSSLKSFSILIISGQRGLGKERFLKEIRYEWELAELKIRSLNHLSEDDTIQKAFYLCSQITDNQKELPEIISRLQKDALGLVVTATPEKTLILQKEAQHLKIPCKIVEMTPLTREDVKHLVSLSTHDENPPQEFIDALFKETKGHPGQTVHILKALSEENKLLNANGQWNLAPFRESGHQIQLFLDSTDVLDDLLLNPQSKKPEKRIPLLLQKAEQTLRKGRTENLSPLFKEVEELMKELPQGQNRLTLRIEYLEKIAWLNIRRGNLDKAKRSIEAAKALENESPSSQKVTLLRLLNFEAYIANQEGETDKAIQIFEKTHKEWKENLKPEEKEKVVNNDIGVAYMNQGKFDEAIEIFSEYLSFYEKNPHLNYFDYRCRYNMAECFLKKEEYSQAIKHYRGASLGARKDKQWSILLRCYNGLGNAYNLLKNSHSSIGNYQRALDLAMYLEDYSAASAVAQNIGVIHNEMGDIVAAKENLNLSLRLLKKIKEPTPHTRYLKARAILELGEIERQHKNYDKANELINEAARMAMGEKGLKDFTFWVLHAKALLALDTGRVEDFTKMYPDLLHHAKTETQKRNVEFLKKRSPIDPTRPRTNSPQQKEYSSDSETAPIVYDTLSDSNTQLRKSPQRALNALLEITQYLNTEHNMDALMSLILKYALNLSGAESGLILLLQEDQSFKVAASQNIEIDEDLSQISQHVAQRVVASGHPIRSDNAMEDNSLMDYQSVMVLGLKSIFCVPIRSQQKILGVLYLTHRFRISLFDDATEAILQAFTDQAGIALENARLLTQVQKQKNLLEERLNQAEEKIESYEVMIRQGTSLQERKFPKIIAQSQSMEKVFSLISRIGPTELSVLVTGESGTGKELVASAIHENSPRAEGPFIAINCGAIPANLLESELFGYVKGAFTGANKDKKGLLEEANGGTVFLDELGELSMELQVKCLRAIQEREIRRVGDSKSIPIDVRFIGATLKNLEEEIRHKNFREDLFYRLAEIKIFLPPLRDRREDIPLLIQHFIATESKKMGLKKPPRVSKELMELFINYDWPGNVRELSNRIRVGLALSDGKIINDDSLPEEDKMKMESPVRPTEKVIQFPKKELAHGRTILDLVKNHMKWIEIENLIMAKALAHHGDDVIQTAKSLKIGQATLYNRVRSHHLKDEDSPYIHHPLDYNPHKTLKDYKKETFSLALKFHQNKPYKAAKALDVSPGTYYKWID